MGKMPRSTQESLARFSPLTREWFAGTFVRAHPRAGTGLGGHRRRRQHAGHRPDRVGQDTGGVPVGLDGWARATRPAAAGTRVLYVSPLKALAVDVERNLRTPLTGIARIAERRDAAAGHQRRRASGDTPPIGGAS